MAKCKHLQLKLQTEPMSRVSWYRCIDCPQKFRAVVWDGKVTVLKPQSDEPAKGVQHDPSTTSVL